MKTDRSLTRFSKLWLILVILILTVSVSTMLGTAAEKPVNLRVNVLTPPAAGYWEHCFEPLFKKIEKLTEGRVTATPYFAGQLCSAPESADATRAGIVDFTWFCQGFTPDKFPLSSVMELPFLIPMPTVSIGGPIFKAIYDEFPEIRDEYKDWHLCWLQLHMAADIHSAKPITGIDQLKGMKILTQPSLSKIEVVKVLGGTPINMDTNDFYTSLERGMADSAFIAWGAYEAAHLYDLTSNHYLIGLLPVNCCYLMNKDTYNSLQPKDQEIVDTILGSDVGWASMRDTLAWSRWRVISGPCGDDNYYMPTPEDMVKAKELVKPIWDKWVQEREAMGLPAQKVLDRVIELVEKYNKV